ncbi:MAG TPA: P1 family peptidase [Steroidobacteraceae bacterium]|nr:P1 family peptidase [Steroidobacteraceae bacterium]
MRSATYLAAIWAMAVALFAALASAQPLTPRVSFEGPSLEFDLAGVEIGVADYEDGPTGATVLYFSKPVKAAVDVRGGAPGTVNTDVLRLAYDEPIVHAIALSGGSAYGLSVATGVANAIKERTADARSWQNVAVVPGAIIFDLGGRRYNTITPDDRLGRAALGSARPGWCPLGARGAGRFAMQGGYFGRAQHSGQGAAFRQAGDAKVLVVTVVNAAGTIVDRNGHVLRCAHPVDGDCGEITRWLDEHLAKSRPESGKPDLEHKAGPTANTTITVVVTNQALPFSALQRLAVQVHNSMARAIQPFGTEVDGDTLFAVTTGEIKGSLNHIELGVLASETAWDAIIASAPVLPETPPRSTVELSPAALDGIAGRYEFAPGIVAQLRRNGAGLEIVVTGGDSEYLKAQQAVALTAVATDEFELAGARADRLHIDRDARGRISGIILNPGPWPVSARRMR